MKRIECAVNNKEYEKIITYCKTHNISIYKLIKDAVFEKTGIERIEGGSMNFGGLK